MIRTSYENTSYVAYIDLFFHFVSQKYYFPKTVFFFLLHKSYHFLTAHHQAAAMVTPTDVHQAADFGRKWYYSPASGLIWQELRQPARIWHPDSVPPFLWIIHQKQNGGDWMEVEGACVNSHYPRYTTIPDRSGCVPINISIPHWGRCGCMGEYHVVFQLQTPDSAQI